MRGILLQPLLLGLLLGGAFGTSQAAGLQITRLEAQGAAAAPFDLIEVQFSHPVQDGTFTLADITAFSGPGAVTVNSVTKVTSQRYVISATGTALDSYSLQIGANILDGAANPLDQDGDGTAGEVTEDIYQARLFAGNENIAPGNTAFDGQALLFAIGSATINGDHSFAHVESQRGATPLFGLATTLAFRSLRTDTASSLRIGGGATVNVSGAVMVTGASELRLKAKDNVAVSGQFIGVGVTLNAASATVSAGSAITADGEGYFNGSGPGYAGNGGAHGGRGATTTELTPQPTYGNPLEPVTLGTGGAVFQSSSAGGGAIRLNVTGTLALDGEVSADGFGGGNDRHGASGGSVWATVGTLTGAGSFTANASDIAPNHGHAGGGRVAVYYGNGAAYTGWLTSGALAGGGVAENGTLVFVDTSVADGAARVTKRFAMNALTSVITWASLSLDNGAQFEVEGGGALTVTGALTFGDNVTMRVHAKDLAKVGNDWIGVGATISAGSCTIPATSLITADGEGYANGAGPGGQSGFSAASHGGRGITTVANAAPVYGDPFEPVALGSGGNVFQSFSGGGGAIRLIVDGTLTLDGQVSADGSGGGGFFSAATGGSIWATVGTLAGAGVFTADASNFSGGQAPASGGRIAVYYAEGAAYTGWLTSTVNASNASAEKGTLMFINTTTDEARVSQRMSLSPDAVETFGALTIDNGALFELGGGAVMTVTGALNLTGNSILRVHSQNNTAKVSNEWVGRGGTINAGSVSVAAGSVITADAEGYVNSTGPGYSSNGGGTHGGRGSNSPIAFYGDSLAPMELGSGGNAFNNTFVVGGGAIRLNVTGGLVLDGEVSADAFSGGGAHDGAAGGSIWVTAATLSGAGLFTANGSSGGDPNRPSGAGGRVAVYFATDGGFTGFLTSQVNQGPSVGQPDAEPGTLVFAQTTAQGNNMRISQRLQVPPGATFNAHDLTIDDAALVEIGGGATLAASGTLTITGNSTVRVHSVNNDAQVGGQWVGRGGTIEAGTLTVAAGSVITADGEGYFNNRGPGYNGGGGGTHGGRGANTSVGYYGDGLAPIELGSGASVFNNTFVAGGGAIRVKVTDTLTLNGKISADAFGTGGAQEGAAGGSIWVTTGTLSGSGIFTANGAAGGDPGRASGGGGRIAVHYATDGGFASFLTSKADRGATVSALDAEHGTVIFVRTTAQGPEMRVSQRYHVPTGSLFSTRGLTVDDAGLFEIAGDATVLATGHVDVSGASEVRFHSINSDASIGGEFAGRGARLRAGSLTLDATAKFNADGCGYTANRGPGLGNVGSSHGGSGDIGNPNNAGPVYGDARAPLDLGTGSSGNGSGSAGGGAIDVVVSGTLTLDGVVSASAGPGGGLYHGAAGGSVFIRAGLVAGTGTIKVHGGNSSDAGRGVGAGGRVAVFSKAPQTLPPANITADPGTSGVLLAQAGSKVVETLPRDFLLLAPSSGYAHGMTVIEYAGLGYDPATTTATVAVRRGAAVFPVASNRGAVDAVMWDSTAISDGPAEVHVIFRNAGQQIIGEGSAPLLINNAAQWHRGTIAANETWAADAVHMVEEDVLVPSGVTVTVEAGAVIKFLPQRRIVARTGGILDADAATAPLPVVFTAVADDSAGGDTNFDSALSRGQPGDWLGVAVESSGQFLANETVETRFARFLRTGNIDTQTWPSRSLNIVRGDVTVNGGQTLTIGAGAVVKFERGRKLTVNGALDAQGTFAQPIALTSISDDSRGGDANRDGNTTTPFAGDWSQVLVNGSATLNHCYIAYGQGTSTVDGLLRINGTATVKNCTVAESLYSGIIVGGTAAVENTLVLRTDRAIDTQSGSTTVTNCVIHDNRVGLFAHGGALIAVNCLVTNSSEVGVTFATSAPTVSHCNVFGNAADYTGMPNQTGSNGNISADPKYRNAELDDFHLTFGSAAIDAADGTQAPAADRSGAPRYNDPRTADTGIATAGGAFADMGMYELVEAADVQSNLDLAAANVAGPGTAIAGEMVVVTWTVRNAGTESIAGPWFDTVAMRAAGGATAAIFAGEFETGIGVVLGPGQSYSASASVRVPGAALGRYEWQVITNSRGTVFEGANSGNNAAVAAAAFDLDLTELIVGAPALARTFAGVDQPLWFKVKPAAGQQVRVALDLTGTGVTELYAARGRMPTRQSYEVKQGEFAVPDVTLTLPGTQAQVCYVLAYPAALAASPQSFFIGAENQTQGLSGLTLTQIGGHGRVTIGFKGALLPVEATYELIGPGGTVTAVEINSGDPSRVFATFDLVNLMPGAYTARVTVGAQTYELPNAVTVVNPGAVAVDKVEVKVVGPPAVREGRTTSVTVEVKNTANVDVYAPVLRLTVDGWAPVPRALTQGVQFAAAPGNGNGGGGSGSIEIIEIHYLPPPTPEKVRKQFIVMPLNPEHPAGILPPGFTAKIVLDGIPELGSEEIELFVDDFDPGAALNHDSAKASYKPADVPAAAWDVIYANFIAGLGSNTNSANATLARSATYLSSIGQRPSEMSEILRWELCKASDFGAIASRYRLGPFGYGSDPMEVRLKHVDNPRSGVAEEVSLFRSGGATARVFTRKIGATAFVAASPGDTGTLVKLGPASYEVQQQGGAAMRFDTPGLTASDLLLTYVDDARQRRISYSYVAGRLTAIANDLGQQRTFGYNAAGRVTSVTNEYGVVTTYGYDAGNEHLTSITEPHAGTTTIEHYQGESAAKEHAVKKVTGPDGRITNYEFDSRGRPSKISFGLAKTEPLTFTYDADGGTITTDAAGGVSRFSRDSMGRVVRTKNHGQNMLEFFYDPYGNQVVTNIPASRLSLRTEHDERHNLTALYDLAGGAAQMTYHPVFNVPASYTDRRSLTTSYTYDDAAGKPNLSRIDYPGGSHEELTYDSRSRVHTHTNARGQTVTWDYDAQDMLTRKTYPNGDYDEFFYNGNRQNTSIVRHIGVTSETTTLEYDPVTRLLTKVTYPNGRFVSYTHDAAGRRASTTTQDGFVTRWDYDSNGRLFHVKNGADEVLVTLTYNSVGRLATRTLANGAVTTYTYNLAGRIQQVTHEDPEQDVIATYTYAYDALGSCISMNGPDGLTGYEYDIHGQLVQAELPGGRILRYSYDAEGNRTEVDDGGVVTPYQPDHLNRYSSIGSDTLTHDEDGNVTSRTRNGQTTVFTYDALNHLLSAVSPGENITFEYDALGNLSASTRNGVRSEFLTDPLVGGDVLGEYGTGGLTAHYVHGGGLNARVLPGGDAAFYLFDGNGHTSHLLDDDGATVNSYRYLPFGEALGTPVEGVPNRFRYGGQNGLMDEGGGLLHVRARFYSPEMGRFMSRDPGYVYGSNPYLYCENHPVGRIDINGADSSPADQQAVQDSGDAGTLGGLLLDITTNAAQRNVDGLLNQASESFQAANANKSVTGAMQLQKQGEGLMKQAANGPAAKGLAFAKNAGNVLNGLSVVAGAGNLLLGDGTKPGLVDRLNSNDPNERMSANADGVLFVASNTLKLLTAEVPFSGEIIDGGIIIVDKGSQAAFEWWFTPNEEDPEDVFNHEAYWRFRKGQKARVIRSDDPNDITGPGGFGPQMWVDDTGTMHYTIRFENKSTAEAAAYRVVVTLPLDANLDWSTFEFEQFGFAGTTLTAPPGLNSYANRTAVATDPNPVKVTAGLNAQTGVVTWLMESFDDLTGDLPEDPFAGFLPPNNDDGEGEGFLTYSIQPKAGASNPFIINAKASIVFDTNPAIETNTHSNSIETGTPIGTVVSLPATIPMGRGGFLVRWGGSGSHSGMATFDVYVSDTGGPLLRWLDNTSLAAAVYPGIAGHIYGFAVVATDNVGQSSLLPVTAELQTQMGADPLFVSAHYLSGISFADEEANVQLEGLLRTNITRGGSVTGTLRLNGRVWSFARKLDAMNRITLPLARSVPALELRFEHAYGVNSAELRGVIAGPDFAAPFQAAPNPFTKLAPCPAAGLYTALLDPDPAAVDPAAPLTEGGYATMRISNLGAVILSGRLANNLTFSATSTLNADGFAPTHVVLPGKKGLLAGGLLFASLVNNSTYGGGFDWSKVTSLTTLEMQHPVLMTGSRYVRANPIFVLAPDADVMIDGGGLATALDASFTFNSRGAIVMTDGGGTQKIRLTLNAANGLLSGSFLYPGTAIRIPLRGALLQTQEIGGGCFIRNGVPGSFSIGP